MRKAITAIAIAIVVGLALSLLYMDYQMDRDILETQDRILGEVRDIKRLYGLGIGVEERRQSSDYVSWKVNDGDYNPPISIWEYVGDASGIVGVTKRLDTQGDYSVYPAPVYDKDARFTQIGWLAAGGFYPLSGIQTPACIGCPIIVMREGEDGVFHRLTIRRDGATTGIVRRGE